MRRTGAPLLVVFLFASINLHAQCGVERWSIKVGNDSQAPSINLGSYVSSTIYNFHQSTRPSSIPSNSRVAPRETTQYSLSGTLKKYKRESDSDYHLVIQDSAGRSMIIELPNINCVGSGSPFRSGISNARAQFDAKLTATSTMKNVTAPVTIRGIGFWDFLHGQTGVAPNGIEVHPVLNIAFTGPITADMPGVIAGQGIAPAAVVMPADLVEDNDGGRVHVFRGGDGLGDVYFRGGAVIEDPRLRVVFAGLRWNDARQARAILAAARSISSDPRFAALDRYGVRTSGMMVESVILGDLAGDLNDLDVQRFLADAVSEGRIQHLDENVVTIVVVDPDAALAVGTTRDWRSYHSQFHPNDLAMNYVVLRADPDPAAMREAMFASVARALINPAGNGWF
jgi:hypothetical protein